MRRSTHGRSDRSTHRPRAGATSRRSLAPVESSSNHSLDRDEISFLAPVAALIVVMAQVSDPGSAGDVAVLTFSALCFVLQGRLRRLPPEVFAALVIGPILVVMGRWGELEPAMFLGVMTVLYIAGDLRQTWRAALIAVAAALSPWLVSLQLPDGYDIAWLPWAMANGFTFSMGRLLYRQRELIRDLDSARRALAAQAVADERRRIARELHDLAGHTLAAMLLHVTGARHVLHRDLDEAERALCDAESIGRDSLDQIRATVAALRTDERGTDPSIAGVADLDGLFDEYRRAGLAVATGVAGTLSDVPAAVGTAVHRIVREALANVARHAPTNRVEVEIVVDPAAVCLLIADHGRRAPGAAPGAGHFGLVGMGERARALGGTMEAGPSADGWRVSARLPFTRLGDRPGRP